MCLVDFLSSAGFSPDDVGIDARCMMPPRPWWLLNTVAYYSSDRGVVHENPRYRFICETLASKDGECFERRAVPGELGAKMNTCRSEPNRVGGRKMPARHAPCRTYYVSTDGPPSSSACSGAAARLAVAFSTRLAFVSRAFFAALAAASAAFATAALARLSRFSFAFFFITLSSSDGLPLFRPRFLGTLAFDTSVTGPFDWPSLASSSNKTGIAVERLEKLRGFERRIGTCPGTLTGTTSDGYKIRCRDHRRLHEGDHR